MIFVVFLILNDNCNPGIKTSWLKNKMYLLLVLVQDAIIKYYRLGALSNKHFFLTVLKAEKSKIKSPTDLVSGEHSLSGLQTAVSSPGGKERDRVGRGGGESPYFEGRESMRAPPSQHVTSRRPHL